MFEGDFLVTLTGTSKRIKELCEGKRVERILLNRQLLGVAAWFRQSA